MSSYQLAKQYEILVDIIKTWKYIINCLGKVIINKHRRPTEKELTKDDYNLLLSS